MAKARVVRASIVYTGADGGRREAVLGDVIEVADADIDGLTAAGIVEPVTAAKVVAAPAPAPAPRKEGRGRG